MFDKNKFAQILKNIIASYDSQRDFAKKSEINRTYLSQYTNLKLDKPPKPAILEKIANASNGLVSYDELMHVCGYVYIDKIDKSSFGINPEYWEMIFGNVNSYTLSTNGSSFLASLLDKGLTGAKVAEKKGENTFIMDFSPEKLIPSTNNYEEFVEYTKIFCFFICTLLSSMTMSESDKNKLLKNVKILLSNIPAQQSKELKSNQLYMCPVYGQIPAGEPNWAEECIEGYLPIDPNLMNIISPEECYFLKVNGESMNKVISNGAYALIRKTDWVENGEIAVILVNGYDATLKKFTKKGDVVVLEPMSNDPSFQTQIYDKNTPIKIIGKYIGKFEMKN